MIEVEIRARVDNFNEIKKRLDNLKADFLKSVHQVDKVFGHSMFLDSENMIIEGGISARIRSVDNKCSLEFKEICRTSGGMELKSELSDINIGIDFLNRLGFKEAFTIDKQRESYRHKNFFIDLDNVDKLGYHQNQKTPFLKMEMNGVVLMSIKICCEKKVPNRLHFLKWSQELFADFFDFIEIEKIVTSPEEKEPAREECIELLTLISPNSKIENKKYGDLMQELINNNLNP